MKKTRKTTKTTKINNPKIPETSKRLTIIRVDPELDKYLDKGLFQEKVDKANEMLRTVGLPKDLIKRD